MKANNKKRNRTVTVALGIAAVGLLAFGSVGGARAAITNYSGEYVAEFETQTLGVAITENGTVVEGDDALMQNGGQMTPGKTFKEELAVTNPDNGTNIEEYVRLTVRKYWKEDGVKTQAEKLGLDKIQLVAGSDDWIMVDEDPNDEVVVFYYTEPLAPGESTSNAVIGLTVDNSIETLVSQETSTDGKTITTTYDYDGLSVGLEAEADGVQTHNAEDAILSAWGINASGADSGTITGIN